MTEEKEVLHNLKGNCWDNKAVYADENSEMNDVCDKHDEPRGDCSECPRCHLCDKESV